MLYVGSKYRLEVSSEANDDLIEPAHTQFSVAHGTQTVHLDVERAVGDVRAAFVTAFHNSEHWAAPLPLPAPFAFRLVHRSLNIPVYTAEVPRQVTPTLAHQLPARHTLFVGETYTLEVGYQLRALIAQMSDEIGALLRHAPITFRGAGERELPYIEHAWRLDYYGDVRTGRRNHETLGAIARMMSRLSLIHI